uniref:Uncharacterized protein n=1 Tax=Anguilla anguilla TaxID=7936 RepID=A0A0E9PHH2_ANGAN
MSCLYHDAPYSNVVVGEG